MLWRSAKQREDPNAFMVMSFGDYKKYAKYRRSEIWKTIKKRILQAASGECAACNQQAVVVHHRDYRPRVLAGLDDTPLVALCEFCHEQVHARGLTAFRSWTQEERVLAELVAKKDRNR